MGKSTGSTGSAQCTPCAAGKYSDVVGEACKDCDKGRYRNSSDSVTNSCRECSKGTYQDSTSAASCLPCLPGEFGNTTGMSQCYECAVGKVSVSGSTVRTAGAGAEVRDSHMAKAAPTPSGLLPRPRCASNRAIQRKCNMPERVYIHYMSSQNALMYAIYIILKRPYP